MENVKSEEIIIVTTKRTEKCKIKDDKNYAGGKETIEMETCKTKETNKRRNVLTELLSLYKQKLSYKGYQQ